MKANPCRRTEGPKKTTLKPGSLHCPGTSRTATYLLALRCPVYRGCDAPRGLRTELENLPGRCEGKRPKRTAREAEISFLFFISLPSFLSQFFVGNGSRKLPIGVFVSTRASRESDARSFSCPKRAAIVLSRRNQNHENQFDTSSYEITHQGCSRRVGSNLY